MSSYTPTSHPANVSAPVELPAGTYWVGDPCYSVPTERWQEWLRSAESTGCGNAVISGKLDLHMVVGIQTVHGDGSYRDRRGRIYDVDAGLLGLVPIEVAENRYPEHDELGRLITFQFPVRVSRDVNGAVRLGGIRIGARPVG